MKANAPEKIYLTTTYLDNDKGKALWKKDPVAVAENIEYTRTDAFIEKACAWIKENITNNPKANSVLVRNGCVTLGMLVEDFKKYMEGE